MWNPGLGVKIGKCCLDSKNGSPSWHPTNVGCSTFRYTKQLLNSERPTEKWTREDNKHVLNCYFKSNPTQIVFRKRIIEIWAESADQARIILKKGWFSDLELQEICDQVNREEYEQDLPSRIKILNTEKPNWKAKYWKLKHHSPQHHKTNYNARRKKIKSLIRKIMTVKKLNYTPSETKTGKK